MSAVGDSGTRSAGGRTRAKHERGAGICWSASYRSSRPNEQATCGLFGDYSCDRGNSPRVCASVAMSTKTENQAVPTCARARNLLGHRLARILVLAFLGSLAGAGYWLAGASRSERPLTIPDEKLDFGEVWENEAFVLKLPITNQSQQKIWIRKFSSSCVCLSIEPTSLELRPAETKEVELTFDLSHGTVHPGQNTRRFSVDLVAMLEGGPKPELEWTVHGQVRRALEFSPSRLTVAEPIVRGNPPAPLTIPVRALIPLGHLKASCSPPSAEACVKPIDNRDAARDYTLEISPRQDLAVGALRFWVVLTPLGRDGSPLPARKVRIDCYVVDDVEVFPERLFLGPLNVGALVEETVLVRSRNGKAFTVQDIENDNANIEVRHIDSAKNKYAI